MAAHDQRALGRLEEAVSNNSKAIDGLALALKEFQATVHDMWKTLAARVNEIEIKLRIGRALAVFVLLLAVLAGIGLKDAAEMALALVK